MTRRVAFLHTGAVVIPGFADLAGELVAGFEVQHLLDDKIVVDLGAGMSEELIVQRLEALGKASVAAGAEALLFTCSSISGFAGDLGEAIGIPVLRIDEAMADEAVSDSERVAVVATLTTTLRPTVALIRERADIQGRSVDVSETVVDGAFEAIVGGNRGLHDQLVVQAIEQASANNDVVVLAQASMASAADAANVDVRVLTSPRLGIKRLAEHLRI